MTLATGDGAPAVLELVSLRLSSSKVTLLALVGA